MRSIVDYLLCNHTANDYTRLVAARIDDGIILDLEPVNEELRP